MSDLSLIAGNYVRNKNGKMEKEKIKIISQTGSVLENLKLSKDWCWLRKE